MQQLMQEVLDHYAAGIGVDQVQLQKVDPWTQVIDAFRDVQAAATDKERLQNEAASYAGRIIPEARGEAERILQGAKAYRQQSVAEATGQSARFLKVYEEYKKAPDATRKRMYFETMEGIMSGTDKIIVDTKGGRASCRIFRSGHWKNAKMASDQSLLLRLQRSLCGPAPEGTWNRSSS